MIIQAFVDDSRSDSGDKEFALAGYMTVAPQWITSRTNGQLF